MTRRQTGIVLLTTMMMIVILTLLVLSLMQGVLLYVKGSNQFIANHQTIHQMEVIAGKLDLINNACVVKNKSPNQLVELLVNHQGCTVTDETRQYEYIIGDLGLCPCLQMQLAEKWYGSHHWLVTLATVQPPNTILQLRIARLAQTTLCELPVNHVIQPGVMSWRKVIRA